MKNTGPAILLSLLCGLFPATAPATCPQEALRPFGIQLVDGATGRGIPMVRLRTTGNIEYWSDSSGWIAFAEPGLMERQVHFSVDSPGYALDADGFGFTGARFLTSPGKTGQVVMQRKNIAERMYRVTGQGIHRDSALLGLPVPPGIPQLIGGVIGSDSVQAVVHRGKVFWLWGDTSLPEYPLGNFHVTAATGPLPGPQTFDPADGIPLEYCLDESGTRVRRMLPDDQPGAVWIFGLLGIEDAGGGEVLLGHYARHLSLAEVAEHGIARLDDGAGVFRKVAVLPPDRTWQHPRGNAVRVSDSGGDWFYFCEPFAFTRVPARIDRISDPDAWQALVWNEATASHEWQRARPPTTQREETERIRSGAQPESSALHQLRDCISGSSVELHRASIVWNAFRKKWVLIGNEMNPRGDPSRLGEVWYAESDSLHGPWTRAIRIASHPAASFYNPRQHPFLATDGGRFLYFEGTFSQMFSGNPQTVPRYEYNQLMYRLDLAGDWTRQLTGQ